LVDNRSIVAHRQTQAPTALCFHVRSRIQLAPHARRRGVPKTVSEWMSVLCAD